MSSIKKVLCLKAHNDHGRKFTAGNVYDVELFTGGYYRTADDCGLFTAIFTDTTCLYGEWQPLEEYVCMTNLFAPIIKLGEVLFGYEDHGTLRFPDGINSMEFRYIGAFKKLQEVNADPKQRHEVRHVIYDTKDNKIANDAMGECYITLAEAQELCDEMNEPKVMKPKYTKEVDYFGMNIFVPDDAKWLSTTMYGTVFAHCSKAAPSESVCFHAGSDDHVVMGGIDLNGIDWKDTLVEIK